MLHLILSQFLPLKEQIKPFLFWDLMKTPVPEQNKPFLCFGRLKSTVPEQNCPFLFFTPSEIAAGCAIANDIPLSF